jgi:PIN domain nuclease of toxin-antitoxin system
MKALLDTHTFLSAIADEGKLSRRAKQIYTGPHDLWLSVASMWEIMIKVQAGKLPLPQPAGPYLVKKLAQNQIELLPVSLDHVLGVETLPVASQEPLRPSADCAEYGRGMADHHGRSLVCAISGGSDLVI